MEKKKTVSILLAVKNESTSIGDAIEHLRSLQAEEVIVIDGGSEDNTYQKAMSYINDQVKVYQIQCGNRAKQFNYGVSKSTGEICLFAHVDLRFPPKAISAIREAINGGIVGGGFDKQYSPSSWVLRRYVWGLNNLYFGLLNRMVGTNGIFVDRKTFDRIGGYQEVEFLEDVLFSKDLNLQGKISRIKSPLSVSSRRYLKRGVWNQMMLNFKILVQYGMFRKNVNQLKKEYEYQKNA